MLFAGLAAHGQLLNVDFSGGLSNWVSLGDVQLITTGNLPPSGGNAVWVSSTNGGGGSDTVPNISTNLWNANLPATDIIYDPTVGQAIYQDFNLATATTLSFEYSYSTNDQYPYDSVGYVLDGNYTELKQTPPSSQSTPSEYLSVGPIALSAGEHQLAFVAYNTSDENYDTNLYIGDITIAPEPATWLTFACGAGVLVVATRRIRSRA